MYQTVWTLFVINLFARLALRIYIEFQIKVREPELREEIDSFGWSEFDAFVRTGEFKERLNQHQDMINLCNIYRVLGMSFYSLFGLSFVVLIANYGLVN